MAMLSSAPAGPSSRPHTIWLWMSITAQEKLSYHEWAKRLAIKVRLQ
jgi:hypothetical protein